MAEHNDLGQQGEEVATNYLKKQGFKILARNWRVHHLEIDIIAEKNKTLHFVEVKTRKKQGLIPARESLSFKKRQNLEKLVELWFLENPKSKQSAQLDFLALTINTSGEYEIEYFPNYTQ